MSTSGVFEVNLEPQNDEATPAGRMTVNKQYFGGMVGTGVGQMISKRIPEGVAIYFAVEEFDGTVDGKQGAFTLVHSGKMSADTQSLEVTIVEGSGKGELSGIAGSLEIILEQDAHKYVLEYTL